MVKQKITRCKTEASRKPILKRAAQSKLVKMILPLGKEA